MGEHEWKTCTDKIGKLRIFYQTQSDFTDVILNKIGMEPSATCKVCNDDDEGFLHLFLYCKELEDFIGNAKE